LFLDPLICLMLLTLQLLCQQFPRFSHGQHDLARQTVKCTAENTKTEEAEANSQVEQQGCDLEHKEELMLHNAEKESHEDNKAKACALMFSCCNKTMQNRIEEM